LQRFHDMQLFQHVPTYCLRRRQAQGGVQRLNVGQALGGGVAA
jgi:hypothetical protein